LRFTLKSFFGIAIVDGERTISNNKISWGNVGALAAAFEVDTAATLNRVIITGTTTPTQELSVGATAEVVFAPRSVQIAQASTLTDNPISFSLPTPAYADISD
jgi:spore coat protein U-like protein